MKRIAMLCCLFLVLAGPAGAQLACSDPDLLAMVFDSGAINLLPTLFTQYNVHVVLLNPSAEPLDGFEFRLVMPTQAGDLVVLGETLPPASINIGLVENGYRDYIVGMAVPRPVTNNRIELVTLSLMSFASTANQDFLLRPVVPASIPGQMAYNQPIDGGAVLRAMYPVSGSHTIPVARLFPTTPLSYCGGAPELTEMKVDITATCGPVSDPLARAGTAGQATDGFDIAYEQPLPALPPANYVSTSFEHSDWPLGPRFNHDIRASYDATVQSRSWPLLLETDRDGLVTLTFTPSFTATDNIHLALRDPARNLYLPLFPHLTHTYRNHGLPTARRFELQVGAVTVPAMSPVTRQVPAGWSLVSLPLEPNAAANTVGAALLAHSPGYAFAYTYAQPIGYVTAGTNTLATTGTGYWLGTTAPFAWAAAGAKPVNGRVMPTLPGWNLVGYPNWTPGSVAGLVVRHDGEVLSWTAAAQAGLVSPDVQGYNTAGGNYYDVATLAPYHAYWVNVLAEGVDIIAFWRNFQYAAKQLPDAGLPDPDAWRTDLVLTDAAGSARTVTLGVDPAGTSGFDALLDRPQPPSPPVPGPEFCLLHPDWQLDCGARFTRDIVGPAAGGALSWPLTITSPAAGPATLRWNTAGWPADLDLQLYLPAENRVLVPSLRAASSVTVTLGGGPLTVVVRTPDATSGVGDLPAAADGRLTVHPNPFNPQATLSFTLPQAAVAEVRVYSLRGELVRVLGGSLLAAGPQQLVWDGSDRRGREVPSGTYFGRLVLDGEASGGIVRMSLVR